MKKIIYPILFLFLICLSIYLIFSLKNNPSIAAINNLFNKEVKLETSYSNNDGTGSLVKYYNDNMEITVTESNISNDKIQLKANEIIEQLKQDFIEKNVHYKSKQNGKKQIMNLNINTISSSDFISLIVTNNYTAGDENIPMQKCSSFIFSIENNDFINLNDLLKQDKFKSVAIDANDAYNKANNTSYNILDNEDLSAVQFSSEKLLLTLPAFETTDINNIHTLEIPYDKLYDSWNFDSAVFPQSYKKTLVDAHEEKAKADEAVKQLQGKKLVALTFDDGPRRETTTRLLDVLKKNEAHATFFILASRLGGNEDILKRQIAEGHQVGSHSQTHRNMLKLSDADLRSEVELPDNKCKEITGSAFTTFRPPYGNSNENVRAIINKPIILWSVDTLDWKTKNPAAIEQEVMSHTFDGSIILMHDIFDTSVNAAESFIPKLKELGYEFVTVDELFKAKDIELQPAQIYFMAKKQK